MTSPMDFRREASGLRHSQAISRLLLVTAVATKFSDVARNSIGECGRDGAGSIRIGIGV